MVNMGQRLKLLRNQNKFTQKQVADRLGLAVSAVSSYESGGRFPPYQTFVKLASMYHVSCDYLIGVPCSRTIDVSDLDEDEILVISQTVDLLRSKHSN